MPPSPGNGPSRDVARKVLVGHVRSVDIRADRIVEQLQRVHIERRGNILIERKGDGLTAQSGIEAGGEDLRRDVIGEFRLDAV
jgi:hypothetical protein